MKNRKLILITLTAILLASIFVISVAAASAVATTDGKACEKGNTVTLNVNVSDATNVFSGAVEVKYDAGVLELIEAKWDAHGTLDGSKLDHFDMSTNLGAFSFAEEKSISGAIFSVTFRVLDNAPLGKSAVSCNIQLRNSENEDISVINNAGYVEVLCTHDFSVKGDQHLASGATCTAPAKYYYTCSHCGELGSTTYESGSDLGHEAGEAATCTTAQKCTVCNVELAPALGHSAGEAVQENVVPSTCTAEGSYNEVVYCSVCNEKLSTTAKTIEKLPHTFDKQVTTPDYLVEEVKCVSETAYYYSCSCGAGL